MTATAFQSCQEEDFFLFVVWGAEPGISCHIHVLVTELGGIRYITGMTTRWLVIMFIIVILDLPIPFPNISSCSVKNIGFNATTTMNRVSRIYPCSSLSAPRF